jgi:hypothetical protein
VRDVAKTWRNRSSTVQLKGFDDFLEKLQKAGATMEGEGRKCFEKCAENLYDELYSKAQKAGLDNRLLEQIDEKFIESGNVWYYEVGWKKQKPSDSNPLPDTYKVLFYNYGTPKERKTRKGYNRGKVSAHPKGSHGFIKKAKLAVVQRNKKLQKETLEKIIGELQ